MSIRINTGIIGFGISGQVFHAPFISNGPGFRLCKISTSNPEAKKLGESLYPETEFVSEAQSILTDKEIDLVIIATANVAHLPLAKQALLAGKHVIVEKPFTISAADADELISLAKAQKRVLTVYHNRRFDSVARTVKKVIESGILGSLAEYTVNYDRFRPGLKKNAWREEALPGSGILYDLGSHLIDQAVDLFGLPDEITADIRIQRPGGKVDDKFELILGYKNLKVSLNAGMLVREPGPHVVINGNSGSYIKYGMDIQEAALRAGHYPAFTRAWGEEPAELYGKIVTEMKGLEISGTVKSEPGNYQDFFTNTYQAIIGVEELLVKPEHARNTIRIIELAMQSSREKRTISYSH